MVPGMNPREERRRWERRVERVGAIAARQMGDGREEGKVVSSTLDFTQGAEAPTGTVTSRWCADFITE